MFRTLTTPQKFSATLAAAIVAAGALILILKINFAPAYQDFIVGSITWRNEGKLQDLLVGPIVIASFSFCLLYLIRLFDRLNRTGDGALADGATLQLLWWAVPALFSFGLLITGANADSGMVLLSLAGLLLTIWALARAGGSNGAISPDLAGWALFAVLLLALVPMEVALTIGRLPGAYAEGLNLQSYIYATYALATFGFMLIAAAVYFRSGLVVRFLPASIVIGQIGVSFLALDAYPARLLSPGGIVSDYPVRMLLPAILAVLVFWSVLDVVMRFNRFRRDGSGNISLLLSPVALFFLMAVAKAGYTAPPHINPDDYHVGEHLVGWWAYLKGLVPYVDYLPPHGLVDDDLAGMLGSFFYDGTAAPLAEASRLAFWLLAFISVLSVHRFSGSVGLALVTAFFLGGRLAWLFLTPFLCLWFSQSLRDSPSRWLTAWVLTMPLILLGVPPQGTILLAASLPYALFLAWQGLSSNQRSSMKAPALALGFLLLISAILPLPSMLFGALRYVWENGPNNQVAYGVPWAISLGKTTPSWIVLELVRMSWIAVPLVSVFLAHRLYEANERRAAAYMPVAVAFIFSLLLIPYSMGRIDPSSLSRPGLAAQFGWVALIPLICWEFIPKSLSRQLLVTAIVVMGAALGSLANLGYISISSFLHSSYGKAGTGVLSDGAKLGLANLGVSEIKSDHLDRLVRINRALNGMLGPGETYLDLTSRNAHYFYLDKLPPIPVTAPYNMVPLTQQQRAIEQLKLKPVRVVLLQADNLIHDGGGLALRSPLLFRFVMDNYLPVWAEGFVFGIRRDESLTNADLTLKAEVRNLSDGNWERGIHRREAAFIAANVAPFSVGSSVQFATGETRRVARVWPEGNAVWVDGAPLDSIKAGAPHEVAVTVGRDAAVEYRARLLDAAFVSPDLGKIPVSWGRSEASLQARMTLTHKLDSVRPLTHQLVQEGNVFKVSGADPQLVYDVASIQVSGKHSGLLRFDFHCAQRKEDPRLQVYWWGDSRNGPAEEYSFKFTAADGTLIVPLDAYPRWLTLDKVKGIRIDLDNSRACSGFSVTNMSLSQRMLGR